MSGSAETLLGDIATHLAEGRFIDAEARALELLQLEPRNAELHFYLGVARGNLGDNAAALASIRQAASLEPDFFEAHLAAGIFALLLGRFEEARASSAAAVALDPESAEAQNNLGLALRRLGRAAEAVPALKRACDLQPDAAEVHENLGQALADIGQTAAAAERFRQAAKLAPERAQIWRALGIATAELGHLDAAVAALRQAVAIDPSDIAALNALGVTLARQHKPSEAIVIFDAALARQPDFAAAHVNLCKAHRETDDLAKAVAHGRQAVALASGDSVAHYNLALALADAGRLTDAEACYRDAIGLEPTNAAFHNSLGAALYKLGRTDDAIASYQNALAIAPDHSEALGNLAIALREYGRLDEARRAAEQAVKGAPAQARHYLTLAAVKRFTTEDPDLRAMQELAASDEPLTNHERIELHFALAKALEDAGDGVGAFEHLVRGNALYRRRIVYDEAATLAQLDRIQRGFTAQHFNGHVAGDPSHLPIFVVGMPRSGTTLVEQMLASHPAVFGAGELNDFRKVLTESVGQESLPPSWPDTVAAMSGDAARRLGEAYVKRVAPLAPQALRIVDKMPANFQFVGPIKLALPNARIIHVRRDPLNTCFSCFALRFVGNLPYAYDLGELGRYYRAYQRLMEHWRRVLPPGAMIEADYEALIDDFPTEARRLIDYCGLDWDDACLAYYKNERSVRTASAVQVRQPIYRTSLDRAAAFAPVLDPLVRALKSG